MKFTFKFIAVVSTNGTFHSLAKFRPSSLDTTLKFNNNYKSPLRLLRLSKGQLSVIK
jgi:hypothetical protein